MIIIAVRHVVTVKNLHFRLYLIHYLLETKHNAVMYFTGIELESRLKNIFQCQNGSIRSRSVACEKIRQLQRIECMNSPDHSMWRQIGKMQLKSEINSK